MLRSDAKIIFRSLVAPALCVCILFASATQSQAGNISQTITKFDSGVQQAIPAVKAFYLRVNDFQQDIYFDSLLFDTKMEMGLTKDKKDTALLNKFSDEEINSRILALSLVSNYSKALLQLADPSKAKTAETDLRSIGNRIADISRKLGLLASATPVVGAYATAA